MNNHSRSSRTLQSIRTTLCALLIISFLPGCTFIMGTEEELPFSSLPENIQTVVREKIGDRRIVEVEKETRFGRTTYEISYIDENRMWELEYSASGHLLE